MASSVVQSTANNNGGGATTVVLTLAAGTTAGNFLSLMLGPRNTRTIAVNGVSDNINGTTGWVIKNPSGGTQNPNGLANAKPAFAYHLNPGAGVTTITVTLDASGVAGGFLSEINPGGATPSFVECIIGDNGSVSVTSWTSNNVATTNGTNVAVHGISSCGTTGITFTAGTGFTALSGTNITGGSNTNGTDADQIFGEFRDIASATTTTPATGTNSPTTTQNSGAIVFLLTPAAGGASASPQRIVWW